MTLINYLDSFVFPLQYHDLYKLQLYGCFYSPQIDRTFLNCRIRAATLISQYEEVL